MTAKPRIRTSTARGREIGDLLRQARRTINYSTIDMGKALGVPQPTISRMETGERGTSDEQLMFYIGYCRASKPVQQQMRELLLERDFSYLIRPHRQPHVSDDLRTLLLHESRATTLCNYESILVPGLLQTPEYARSIIGSSTD